MSSTVGRVAQSLWLGDTPGLSNRYFQVLPGLLVLAQSGNHCFSQIVDLIRPVERQGQFSAAPNDIETAREFVDDVRQQARGHPEIDPNHAVQCVFRLLERKLSGGLMAKVLGRLPAEMQAHWREELSA